MRLPKSLKRDPAYLFVTVRKGEKVNNEVAVMLGFAPKPGSGQTTATAAANGAVPAPASSASDPSLAIGSARYALVVKGANAWVQNPADESKVVAEMARGKKVVIKAVSQRGNTSTDEYALDGFGEAMKRTRRSASRRRDLESPMKEGRGFLLSPLPLCGGWPAEQAGRGEPRFRKRTEPF